MWMKWDNPRSIEQVGRSSLGIQTEEVLGEALSTTSPSVKDSVCPAGQVLVRERMLMAKSRLGNLP
jgi:hypothetical protein